MLLLLPPSEGKASGRRGRPLHLDALSSPGLNPARARVLDALVAVCRDQPTQAMHVLGLAPGLVTEVERNAALLSAATLPVSQLYTGVLYDALDLASLDAGARRRAARSVVVVSALFGALRPADRVPPYRLSMGVDLPGVGRLASAWRGPLGDMLPEMAGRGLVVDLRSSTYAAAWRPVGDLAARTVAVRVLSERDGQRTVVSHMAKHTRGEVARHLLVTGTQPRTPQQLAEAVAPAFRAELEPPARRGGMSTLDIVVPG